LSHRVVFRPQAADELLDAARWYEANREGLGADFLEAVDVAVQRIQDAPLTFPVVHETIRRVILKRFPYGIYFRVQKPEIVVLAVMHSRRDPRRWQSR